MIFLTKFAVSCLNAGVRRRHLLTDLRSSAAILRAGGATSGQLHHQQRGQATRETSPVQGEIHVLVFTKNSGSRKRAQSCECCRWQGTAGWVGGRGGVAVCTGILLPVITSCTFLSSSFYSSSYISQIFGSLSLFMSLTTGSTVCTVNTRTLPSR